MKGRYLDFTARNLPDRHRLRQTRGDEPAAAFSGLGIDAPIESLVISAHALGAVARAPVIVVLAVLAAELPRRSLLMAMFARGNEPSALAPSYGSIGEKAPLASISRAMPSSQP